MVLARYSMTFNMELILTSPVLIKFTIFHYNHSNSYLYQFLESFFFLTKTHTFVKLSFVIVWWKYVQLYVFRMQQQEMQSVFNKIPFAEKLERNNRERIFLRNSLVSNMKTLETNSTRKIFWSIILLDCTELR